VSTQSDDTKDRFGIEKKYPTIQGGREWFAKWDNGITRSVLSGDRDPYDSEFLVTGDVREARIMGDGRLRMSGDAPRFSIYDNAGGQTWQNVEQTAYFYLEDQNQPIGSDYGIALEARYGDFGPFFEEHQCSQDLGYSYAVAQRYKNARSFTQKEVIDHGAYTNSMMNMYPYGTGVDMPKNKWFGLKLVIRNMDSNSKVNIEFWFDKLANNNWVKLFEFTDSGNWFATRSGVNANDCQDRPLNWIILHHTNAVRFRADYANPVYIGSASVREIAPLP
jgi:hypothetical protein